MPARAASPVSDACEVEFVDEKKVRRFGRAVKPPGAVAALSELFKVLGDPTRIRIAYALSREELCAYDISNLLGVSQSAVSHSLRTRMRTESAGSRSRRSS